ncbi:MAG: MFS transporter [Dehalococcoidia bacterium]|jgi:MFS family permease|nr:MFS transporter [Dehalococcoidia bacterium]
MPKVEFYGWKIVALMIGPRSAGNGVYILGNTLFVIPLEESLGLGRSVSSLMFALGGVIGGISAPVSGILMDRWGPRRVLIISVLIGCIGYFLLGLAPNILILFLIFLGPISLVMLNVAFNASSGIINNWFDRYKSTAFSLMQGGSGLGSLIIITVLAYSIDSWGWRTASGIAGLLVLAIGLPTAYASRNTPEELGLQPDGTNKSVSGSQELPIRKAKGYLIVLEGMDSMQAMKTIRFWMLAISSTIFGGAIATLGIHFVPIMVWKGLTEVQGAMMLTFLALGSAFTVIFVGTLADRYGRLLIASIACIFLGIAIFILRLGGTGISLWIAVAVLSASSCLYPLTWSIVGELFGRKSYSTIRGYMMAVQSVGTLVMPLIAGFYYDSTEDYSLTLMVLTVLWMMAAVLLFVTPRKSTS